MALSLAEGCIENKKLEIVASASCAKSKVKDIVSALMDAAIAGVSIENLALCTYALSAFSVNSCMSCVCARMIRSKSSGQQRLTRMGKASFFKGSIIGAVK